MMAGPGELSSRGEPSGRGRWKGLKRSRVWLLAGAAGLAVGVVVVTVGALLLGGSGPAHALVTPAKLGAYVRKPQLEQQMNAKQLQQQVVAKSAGQASDVVDAVYEANSAAAGGTSPQVILFIGGHLSGVSPTGFITSFTDQFKGASSTGAGSMGGQAACVNAQAERGRQCGAVHLGGQRHLRPRGLTHHGRGAARGSRCARSGPTSST